MPQHDLVLDNGSGAAFRTDANNALAALGSTMKGPNAPPAPIAGMMWLDDDTPSASVWTLKLYDGADWISIATFDISTNTWAPAIARLALGAGTAAAPAYSFSGDTDTGIYSAGANELSFAVAGYRAAYVSPGAFVIDNPAGVSDIAYFARCLDASASNLRATNFLSLNESSIPLTSFRSLINTDGSGNIELYATPAGSRASDRRVLRATIPGSGAIALVGPVNVDGKALQIQRGTEQATTSGTAIDFTGIPAGVRRITVMFDAVSFNGSDGASIQLGDSGGIETTGYAGNVSIVAGASAGLITSLSSAAGIIYPGTTATDNCSGVIQIVNQSGNKWLITGQVARNGAAQIHQTVATKTLSDVLDRIRFKVDGASNFDAGAINIFWEF